MIELERVGKTFGRVTVLDEVSMRIEKGSATAIIGRNGSGKSTLLSILAGLTQVSRGRVVRRNNAVNIGYAPEFFPGLKFTPEQFLRSIGRMHRLAAEDIEHRITDLHIQFRLESFRSHPMGSFSKGMLQKVNLMQSFISQPGLLLLDEPLSGLDAPAQEALTHLLMEMKKMGTAIIFSVHEPELIEALADEVHVLENGRMVKTVQQSELRSSSSSSIVFKGMAKQEILEQLQILPGFLSTFNDSDNLECMEISVQTSYSDNFLRVILDGGCSVVSVEPSGGLSGLEHWMSPQKNHHMEAL